MTSFIEVQFPVSKVSKECYKERKAGQSQTLTGLGKWWGRKPLFLVRSLLLGLLMPASADPVRDREIFLKILMMDDVGLRLRKNKSIPKELLWEKLTDDEVEEYEFPYPDHYRKLSRQTREELQNLIFGRLTYDQKLEYCLRTEETELKDKKAWAAINDHLGTDAQNLPDLIRQLGKQRFGKVPTVGDCFAGGGSVPFEAARIGCEVYASDLNPLAGLLTWASLNILSLPQKEIQRLRDFQERVFDSVAEQVDEWGIEKNEDGWIGKYYLYCHEAHCHECQTLVPLSSTWEVSRKTGTVAMLKYNEERHGFDIDILEDADAKTAKQALSLATIRNLKKKGLCLWCPKCKETTPIEVLRRERTEEDGNTMTGLRQWEAEDIVPQPLKTSTVKKKPSNC